MREELGVLVREMEISPRRIVGIVEFQLQLDCLFELRIEETRAATNHLVVDFRLEEYFFRVGGKRKRPLKIIVPNLGVFTTGQFVCTDDYFNSLRAWYEMNTERSSSEGISRIANLRNVYEFQRDGTHYRIEFFSEGTKEVTSYIRVWKDIMVDLPPAFDRRRKSTEVIRADISHTLPLKKIDLSQDAALLTRDIIALVESLHS